MRIKLKLFPTFDFTQEILSHGANVTVISPESFRDEIAKAISEMYKKYN
ncbi:WYL domain-containing protein [Epilithonimonas hominis]|nr:WYL domain-containing protein [Epilithonimonas hominis]